MQERSLSFRVGPEPRHGRRMDHGEHLRAFEEHRRLRAGLVESWPTGGRLHPAVARSLQRFQVGEDGDGACLIDKSERAGNPTYLAAVRLFVAEEQNHARLLANLLAHAGQPTISGHWTDAVFVAVRRRRREITERGRFLRRAGRRPPPARCCRSRRPRRVGGARPGRPW